MGSTSLVERVKLTQQLAAIVGDFGQRIAAPLSIETVALYYALPTDSLHVFRDTFTADLAGGAERAFCEARLDLIARILRERGLD